MAMTIAEKILARQAGRDSVAPGDIVFVRVETCIVLDSHFRINGGWRWPKRVFDPERIVAISDHFPLGGNVDNARSLQTTRQFVRHFGIGRFHDAGADQGISHQVIADHAYALPGTVLVCTDSHTLSGGAFNCCARGIGRPEITYVLCHGQTWFRVGPTVRYELHGALPDGVTAKDAFLYLAGRWGSHVNMNIEFGGPAMVNLSMDARRTLSTMCAEVSAEFALWEPDDVLLEHVRARTERPFEPTWPDPGASYIDVRRIDLSTLVPYVSGIDTVIHNTTPVDAFKEDVRVDQCVIGSCANGTLDDLAAAAEILRGRTVAPWVKFIVTPGSMEIYRLAAAHGILATIAAAGALITPSVCGACGAHDFGALGPGEVCLTATTRNYKGRMGHPDARIYLASPATVAASAVAGRIIHPARLERVDQVVS
jgi:3-isopropylmalate/(R)-2-methylmalate dehydratase large subunit